MTDMMDKISRYLRIAEDAFQIADSAVSAKTKYTLIFDGGLCRTLDQIFSLDYVDPDTSYEDDVAAYVTALHAKCAELRQIVGNGESLQ
jgi:hypothetical protein